MRRLSILLLLAVIEVGCAYHGADNPSSPSVTALASDQSSPDKLSLDAAAGTGAAAGTATVTATVTTATNTPLANITVTFSVDVGTIEASAVTNAKGVATVAMTGSPGAARITARVGSSLSISTLVTIQPVTPYAVSVACVAQIVGVATPCTARVKDGTTEVTSRFVAFAWNFGDGATTATVAPLTSHAYATSGTFTVSVSVEDSAGRTGNGTQSVNVPVPGYLISLVAAPSTVVPGGSSLLTATVTLQNGAPAPTIYAWDCRGDGTSTVITGSNAQGCTYATLGITTSKVTVTGGGVVGSGNVVVTVAAPVLTVNCTPGARVSTPPASCIASATVATVPIPSISITPVSWDWGDSSPIVPTPTNIGTHAYTTALTYTVVASATIAGTTTPAVGSATITVGP